MLNEKLLMHLHIVGSNRLEGVIMKIAVIGDLHYPGNSGITKELTREVIEAKQAFYPGFLDNFFNMEADLYVSIGDLTHIGSKEEFTEVFNIIGQYGKDFRMVLGNHDLYTTTRENIIEEFNQFGIGDYLIESDEAILVFLETARELVRERWNGTLSDKQLSWLDNIITSSGEKPVVIFAHHPLHNMTARSNVKYLSIEKDIDLWSILEKKQGKGIYVNGHVHTDSIVFKGQWTFVQLCDVIDHQSARLIDIQSDYIDIIDTMLDFENSLTLAEQIGDSLEAYRLFPEGVGTPLLREMQIKL